MMALGNFRWLSQDEERPPPDQSAIPAPPAIIGANVPPVVNNRWSTVEKIMLTSLLLNAIWFAVYAVRSGPHVTGGD